MYAQCICILSVLFVLQMELWNKCKWMNDLPCVDEFPSIFATARLPWSKTSPEPTVVVHQSLALNSDIAYPVAISNTQCDSILAMLSGKSCNSWNSTYIGKENPLIYDTYELHVYVVSSTMHSQKWKPIWMSTLKNTVIMISTYVWM